MAGKNHRRYQIRKRINQIKHTPKPRFLEPAKFISGWKDLKGLETEYYYIEVHEQQGNGYVYAKEPTPDNLPYKDGMYLSTHTFYHGVYFQTTQTLREMGFNVQLKNWDGETLYCR